MSFRDLDHLSNSYDVSSFFDQGLSDLEIVDSMGKLGNYTKNMLLNEVAYQIRSP